MPTRPVILCLVAAAGGCGSTVPTEPAPPSESSALRLVWTFEAPRPGSAVATPLVTDGAIYFAAVHARGFDISGAVYAIDPATGKPRWTFDHDGEMLATASSPVLDGGRLLFGEGMHANFSCRCYCLDPATGKPHWTFPTGDHIEGGPVVDGETAYFPAGNDGLYAVDVMTGAKRWNFRADLHIDATPAIVGGHLYIGSGPSKKNSAMQVVCLDATTGNPRWRVPVSLPAWSTPLVVGNRVYAGLGNGRLTKGAEAPEVPAGAVVCLDAATGEQRWSFPVGDSVFARPEAAGGGIVFASRDGNVYGITVEGRERYRVAMGGPVIAPLTLVGDCAIAASVPGRIACIDPANGREVWRHELARASGSARVYAPVRLAGNRLYVAAEMHRPGSDVGVVTLFCYEVTNR